MKKRGFTLIELLVVIAIIGILAVIIILNLANASEKARYSKVKSELKTIEDAVTLSFVDGTAHPVSTGGVFVNLTDTILGTILDSGGNKLIATKPTPPPATNGFGTSYQIYVANASDHAARVATPGSRYCVFKGGTAYSGKIGTDTTIYTSTGCDPQ